MIKISSKNTLRLFFLIEISFIVYATTFFLRNHYLPSPFFSDVHDTWMDFFHINFIAMKNESYAQSQAIYSTLNMWIAKLLVSKECSQVSNSFDLRSCDYLSAIFCGAVVLVLNFLLIIKIMYRCTEKYLWALVMTFSFPMLFGLERGNYIFLALFGLSMFVLVNNTFFKALVLSIPLVMKFYLLLFLGPFFLRYKYWYAFITVALIVVLNYVFGLLTNTHDWYLIVHNILSFGAAKPPPIWVVGGYPSIFNPYIVLQTLNVDNATLLLSYLVQSAIIFIIIARLLIWFPLALKNKGDIHQMLLVLLLAYLLLTTKAGYYSFILIFPFMAYLLSKNLLSYRTQLFFLLSLMPYPFKWVLDGSQNYLLAFSAQQVTIADSISANSFFPTIFLFLMFYDLTRQIFCEGEIFEYF